MAHAWRTFSSCENMPLQAGSSWPSLQQGTKYESNFDQDKLAFQPTQSGNHVMVDHNQVVYKSSSLAILKAKAEKKGQSTAQLIQYARNTDKLTNAKRVINFMHDMWKDRKMCDVALRTADDNLFAHKITMGAFSDLLAHRFSEDPPGGMTTVDVSQSPTDIVKLVLHFLYTTDIVITDSNLGDLMACCIQLGIEILMDLCMERLRAYNTDTAFLYYSIAERHNITDLMSNIFLFICYRFVEISQHKSFVHLPYEKLGSLLGDDRVVVPTELDVFYALVRWVDYNRQERLSLAPELLTRIRLQLISPELLITRVEAVDYIFNLPQCHQQLYMAMCFHSLKATGSRLVTSYPVQSPRSGIKEVPPSGAITAPPVSRPENSTHFKDMHTMTNLSVSPRIGYDQQPARIGSGQDVTYTTTKTLRLQDPPSRSHGSSQPHLVAVAVGGIDLQSLETESPGTSVYQYDTVTRQWIPYSRLGDYTHHHQVAALNGKLYLVGGAVYDSCNPDQLGMATSATYMYDPRMSTWIRLADMQEARAYLGLAVFCGCLYAVGGEDNDRRMLSSIERYDPSSDTWCDVGHMPGGGRIGAAVATYQDCLYIIGGYNKDIPTNHVLRDVLCFDLVSERWIPKTSLVVPRCHASLVEAEGSLFLVGGRTKLEGHQPAVSSLASILRYELSMDHWQHETDMKTPRHDAGCAAVGSHIYIVGGMRTPSPYCLASVECYDVQERRWVEYIDDLPHAATGVACCTLE